MKLGVLEDIISFANGKSIKPGGVGAYLVFGANGVIGGADDYNHENAIILGRVGAYCGAVEVCDERFWASDNTIVVKPKSNDFSKSYTYYLLKYLDLNKFAGGSAQPLLTQTSLKKVPVSYYDDAVVRDQIGQLLAKYDNLIENNRRRIAILEDMAKSIYREWFVKFRFPGHVGVKFKNSTLGEIPVAWKVGIIKDLGIVHTGKTPSKKKDEYYASNDIPFLKTPDMHGSVFAAEITDYLSFEGADSQKNKYIPKDSICVSCIGARAGVVTITASVVQTNQQINSIILNDISMREYFYLFAVSLHDKIHAIGSSGATMTNVSKGKFETIEVIIPPKEILDRFNLALKSQFDLILNLQKRNNNLKKQRDMLLPKLISGSIDV
jgi:type I restriction enzyme S subunit